MSDTDYEQRLTTTGRNDRCPCSSGKKYKKCHLAEDEGKRFAALKALEEAAKARAAEKAEAEADEEAEESPKKADKSKRTRAARNKAAAGSKRRAGGGKPQNVPRRGAV